MTSVARSLEPQYSVIEVVHTGDVSDSHFRHAHVWSTDAHARLSMDMWKTVENLHGHAARGFGDRQAALEWLSE